MRYLVLGLMLLCATPLVAAADLQLFLRGSDSYHYDQGTVVGETMELEEWGYAMYAIPSNAAEPEWDTLAINASGLYWVGMADLNAGRWIWSGPYTSSVILTPLSSFFTIHAGPDDVTVQGFTAIQN